MKDKNKGGKIPSKVWLLISFLVAMVLWYLLSLNEKTARSFPNILVTLKSAQTMIERGVFWKDIQSSLISVSAGFVLGFVLSLPTAILMAWYRPVRNIISL